MRRLLLLRHAKSDNPSGVADRDRPLNPRGLRAAPRMGAYLAAHGLRPDHVVVSPARRTQETWTHVHAALGGPDAQTVESIYEAPGRILLGVVRAAPAGAGSLLMIGHNPGLQDLALRLAGAGPEAARARLSAEFPTAALAVIAFDADDWASVAAGAGRLERFVAPKDLDAEDAA